MLRSQSEDWDRGHLSWYKVNFAFIIPLLFISFLKLIDEMILNSQKRNKSTVANILLKPTSSGNSVNGLFVAKNRNKWTGSTCDKFLQSIFYYLRRYTWIRGFAGRCDWFLCIRLHADFVLIFHVLMWWWWNAFLSYRFNNCDDRCACVNYM